MSDQSYTMRRFDSIGDFVTESVKRREKTGASSKLGDWSGSATFEIAVDHAMHGTWKPENVGRFENMFAELEPHLRKFQEIGFENGVDVGGHSVNMDAYLTGEPENMFEFLPTEHTVTKRAVCLLIGHSISAYVSAEELFAKGQAIIALVRSLNLLGFELEVFSEQTVGGEGRGLYSILTKLVGAGDVMDESAVEYAVGNPSWLRRMIFGFEEGESAAIRAKYGFRSGGGYGSPRGLHHGELVSADVEIELGRDWFDHESPEQAMDWVLKQLKEIGAIDADAEVDWEA